MTLVGDHYLVYLPTASFREVMGRFVDPDEYGCIYKVQGAGAGPSLETRPSRSELSTAHWTMFLILISEDFGELKQIAEAMGFDACWQVHSELDVMRGDVLINDVKSLSAK